MPRDRHAQALADLFGLLADPTRVRIIRRLQQREHSVGELCQRLDAAQPTVSHHLRILRSGDLVISRREGKQVYYSLAGLDQPATRAAIRGLMNGRSALRLGPLALALARSARRGD